MEIGLFQLENLILSRVAFCLLDLRERAGETDLPEPIQKILAQSQKVEPRRVVQYLSETQLPKEAPIVLLCERGRESGRIAVELEKLGHSQVYVIEGGLKGLLSEL